MTCRDRIPDLPGHGSLPPRVTWPDFQAPAVYLGPDVCLIHRKALSPRPSPLGSHTPPCDDWLLELQCLDGSEISILIAGEDE